MKKILSLLLAVVMIMAMTIPVFAAEGNDATIMAGCTHTTGLLSDPKTTYVYLDNEHHSTYRTYRYYCIDCGKLLYFTDPILLGTDEHTRSTGTYVSSTHTGDYSTHFYTLKGTCTDCNRSITWKALTRCTKSSCVDPY